jgi:hypothetical protein
MAGLRICDLLARTASNKHPCARREDSEHEKKEYKLEFTPA